MSDVKNVSVETAVLNKEQSDKVLAELSAAEKKAVGIERCFTPVISGISNTRRDEFDLVPPRQ